MTDMSDLSAAFIEAHAKGTRFLPAMAALSRDEILAVQSAVSTALGPVAGFKVAQVPDAPPIIAPIAARYRVEDGGTKLVGDRFGIELEIGFELLRPLPTPTLPARPQEYFRPCAVFELVDTRLAGEAADNADLKFADFQINAGLVTGARLDDWDGSDFGTLKARLVSETETVIDGDATVPGGSALANLALLIEALGDHCGGLQVGQTVITGSLCGLPWFTPDADVTGWIEGLGEVSVKLRRA